MDIAGVTFVNDNERLWGRLGIGGTYSLRDDNYSFCGELSARTSLTRFGDSHSVSGIVGFRVNL